MEKVFVDKIQVVSLAPKNVDPAFKHLLPKNLIPERISFEIHGVSNAVSNAIRRTAMSELDVKYMYVEIHDIKTTEPFIIQEMVTKRLKMIPLKQSTPMDAVFELTAENTTAVVRDVKSSEITMKKGVKSLPFNETFTLFTLSPGTSIAIAPITVQTAKGYNPGDGMCAMAVNAVSIAKDQTPINLYKPEAGGLTCSMSNPRVWEVAFTTTGTMSAKEIVLAACDNILGRVNAVKGMINSISISEDEYHLVIGGESDTIGNLFMKTILELFPNNTVVVYVVVPTSRTLTIKIRTKEDINRVYSTAIRYMNDTFNIIKGYF